MSGDVRRLALAVTAGALLAAAHSTNWQLAPLAVVAVIAFAAAVGPNRRWNKAAGLLGGFAYFALLFPWMGIVGTDAWLALAGICAAWWGFAFSLVDSAHLWRLPTLITAAELLRDRLPWGGFGWGQLGALAIDLGPVSGWLPIVGQVALTWLLWALGPAVLIAIRRTRLRGRTAVALAAFLAVGAASNALTGSTGDDGAAIAIVQAGVDHTGLGTLGDRRAVLERHVSLTRDHLTDLNGVDLVVWPENSSDVDPNSDSVAADWLTALDEDLTPPLLVGAVVERSASTVGNVSLLYDGNGPEEVYAKQRLVPFGEFMPLRDLITAYTERAALMPRDFEPGDRPGEVVAAGARIGVLICFEVADDNLAWDREQPVSALVVQTNNATYDGTEQSAQQLRYARVRAAELRVPVLVASTNGVSAVIAPDGSVSDSVAQGDTGVLTASVPRSTQATTAAWLHDVLVLAILLAAVLLTASQLRRRRSSRVVA